MLTGPKEETAQRNGEVKHPVQFSEVPQRRWKPWIIAVLATGLLSIPVALHLVKSRSQVNPDLITALTVPVEAKDLTVKITASGVVQPVRRVNLSPKTQGRLAQLYVEQGDRVQAGEVVARMESGEIEAQLQQAEARLDRAQANLDKLQTGTRPEEIDQAQARLNQVKANLAQLRAGSRPEEIAQAQARLREAQARFKDAQSGSLNDEIAQAKARIDANEAELKLASERVRRYQDLKGEGAISQDQLDEYLRDERRLQAGQNEAEKRLEQLQESRRSQIQQRQANVEQERQALNQLEKGARSEEIDRAEAEVAEAESKLNELLNGTRSEEIATAKAEVDEAKGQVKFYQVQLEDTKVRAPFAGIITQRYAVEGAFVTPATSASDASSATSTSIVALAKDLEVLAKIPEADIAQIKPNQPVEIIADSYPDQVFKGRVNLIAPEAVKERDVTLFQARILIETGKDQLQSGMNVDLRFIGEKLKQALVVPTVAIVTNKGQSGVLLPDENNKPEFHPVTIGSQMGNQIQVLKGLQPGERVFIELPKGQKLEDIFKGKIDQP
ncbi:efflux RND transporter periplasmic adaptor subunit [Planktothrix sp. FACHB-1365]|uniref:efflux RND transporter periplasmic adaptor subunit n=1 Tax=Planktothrix sp. FACHB-1365 TaxID=2692855 RepID=UPI001687A769|nr:efflux RND transporter periplasmic adaptor subunit [Planktothrix sp. FACHB-1365]MBD2484487.1 efflux RND transporter periplasmic adaptor subunit [Planktothrix sp. FACHB-1365]